jgi:bifunctional UDP-N-acetylglucosamine pyrophosphorylase/glucosamine-1-phosphate N-acetyltransferase
MAKRDLACVILAAGLGTRMCSAKVKCLHELAGLPMIRWLVNTVEELDPKKIIVVRNPDCTEMTDIVSPHETVIQTEAAGTADAVKSALPALDGFKGDVMILLSDMPLLSVDMLGALIEAKNSDDDTAVSVMGIGFADNTPPFGRMVMGQENLLEKIVEDKDCSAEEKKITLCNSGAFCVDGEKLADWIAKIGNDNAQGEYYITDLPEIAAAEGKKTRVAIFPHGEKVSGVNTRAELADMEKIVQDLLRRKAMEGGATLLDPSSIYFSWDTIIGRDVLIEPNVFFGPGVRVTDNVTIKAFSHIEGAEIGAGAVIGPFARLRPGADIGADSKIGNFVEIKNATLGQGVKASHLSYIGDADVGAGVNFSCGAITVNYDGFEKHRTIIGSNAMIGSNVNLVAPVEVGAGAFVAAGSTISKNIPTDSLAVAREKPMIKEGWAASRRSRKKTA